MKLNLLLSLVLCGMAWGQPDAPKPQPPPEKHCGPRWAGGCWDYGHRNLTVAQTFKSPWWYGPTVIWVASAAIDSGISYTHLSSVCSEGNADLPPYPSIGQYAEEFAKTDLPLIAFGWAITKLNRRVPHYIYIGMTTYATTLHARGAYAWRNCP